MLQFVILLPIVLIVAIIALHGAGGLGHIIETSPPHFWDFTSKKFTGTILAVSVLGGIFAATSGGAAQRYFSVRNENGAKKVAVLTGLLMIVGPLIWFVPPMIAAYLYQNGSMTIVRLIPGFPIRESAYVLMCRRLLPTGLVGLVLAAMFAATMSSIDSSFNFRGAILSRDIIRKYFWPEISDRRLLFIGRIVTAVIGFLSIVICVLMYKYGRSLFDIMFTIGGKIGFPAAIPVLFGLLVKNTKRWSAFACLGLGLILGLTEYVLRAAGVDLSQYWFWKIEWQILWIGAIVLAVYFVPGWISPRKDPEYRDRVDKFWKKIHTPINEAEELGPATAGVSTFSLTGVLTIIIGMAIGVLYIVNPDKLILITAGMTVFFGAAMWLAGHFARVKE